MSQFPLENYPEPEPEKKPEFRQFFRDIFETILISVVLFLLINAVSARIRVESISMQPTLFEGDLVLVNRIAYKLGLPQRGDIIVFRYPVNPDSEPYIKRIIGLPGDIVRVDDGRVFVNDQELQESYVRAPIQYSGSWVVPSDEFFVMGDNRNNSSDSHSWGTVPDENVIGKAEFIYWPPEKWKTLYPSSAQAAYP